MMRKKFMDLLKKDGKLRFGQSNSFMIYIKNFSFLKPLFKFLKKSDKELMVLKLIN